MEQLENPFSRSNLLPVESDLRRMGRFGKFTVFPSYQRQGFYLVTELYQMATEAARKEIRGL